MIKKNNKRGGGKSVSKKQKSIYNIPNFLTDTQNDLTLSLNCVEQLAQYLRDELDLVESFIEENCENNFSQS